jgi:hypothetical protein
MSRKKQVISEDDIRHGFAYFFLLPLDSDENPLIDATVEDSDITRYIGLKGYFRRAAKKYGERA